MNRDQIIRRVREAVPDITDPRLDVSDDGQMAWFVCHRERKAHCVAVETTAWSPYMGYLNRVPRPEAQIVQDIVKGLQ